MINEGLIYFNELSKHRAHLASVLDDPALRGVKTSVVEKYSDQAHFIYELLQNADDAKATEVQFQLYEDKLVFIHNGTRRFSISNHTTENEDKELGKLGDINAITSIAHSSKIEASIGKFGVGFKSVFQYTLTPIIYDPGIYFKIHSFIVPEKLEKDYPGRGANETIFVFPFNHPDRPSNIAFTDISEKLRSLDHPVLFLSKLNEIRFNILGERGGYSKTVHKDLNVEQTVQKLITLEQWDEDQFIEEKLWLFSRITDQGQTYSVGFFLDEKGKLMPKQYAAFCFFPTKEVTNLNFIIHAPFLLTDSREGIHTSKEHNYSMIELLADLAADSLVYLRDIGLAEHQLLIVDDIFDIIPYEKNKFSEVSDKRKISFKPFYEAILEKMEQEKLLPTKDGYVSSEQACWASVPQIAQLFSKEKLPQISGVKDAQWVFTSFGRQDTLRKNKVLTDYIESIIHVWLDESDLIDGWSRRNQQGHFGGITEEFIGQQSVEWLHNFYEWLSETRNRTNLIRQKPIFLNHERKAVAAIDKHNQIVLFLPTEVEGYTTVLDELLMNDKTVAFLTQLGVKKPALRDEIYNHILPIYENNEKGIKTETHFSKFFTYYTQCSKKESEKFIELIKDYKFVLYSSAVNKNVYRGTAQTLYLPTEFLRQWFKTKESTNFVMLDDYIKLVGEHQKEELIHFLKDLGVHDQPRILERSLTLEQALEIHTKWDIATKYRKWTEKYIDGCEENIEAIIEQEDKQLSLLVWQQLVALNASMYSQISFKEIIYGKYSYFYRNALQSSFDSTGITKLRTKPWLFDRDGEPVAPENTMVNDLALQYDVISNAALVILQYLKIQHGDATYSHLTEEERKKLQIVDAILDIPEEELKRFAQQYRAKQKEVFNDDDDGESVTSKPISTEARIAEEIGKRAISQQQDGEKEEELEKNEQEQRDEDEYIMPAVNFKQKIEREMERGAHEIARIARLKELTQQAFVQPKYSYGWFKALLDLEAYNQEEKTHSREISVSFAKVEREANTSRILILKYPNRYIPHSIEELADIPLDLYMQDGQKVRAIVEVVNVKSYTLRAKLKPNVQLDEVDLSLVKEAKIEAKNPVFLLEELRKAFHNLNFEDSYNMQQSLCENIEFVFGPPGTGKTTHLATEVILPLVNRENPKILVLTPTNKSADVLVRRLMDLDEQQSYKEWLVRFGATNDSVIEQSGVFYDKTIDIQSFLKNVTVTTIARFPYDFFIPNDEKRLHLSEINWDYIIIDEASMIPLVNILLPLYKKTPKKFIIAGDPFQIEPITTVDLWKNENIYTMVQLKSFKNPKTIPHPYEVTLLTTQYRSIPEIGEVFSRLAYGGVLHHHRGTLIDANPQFAEKLDIQPLTLMKFPVSKYESIYRPKSLQNRSNYHIYAALFTFEYVKYVSSLLEENEKLFRIGIIAPYRAQSDLLEKLMSSYTFPSTVGVQVGTIHGFQGDECDMIIALFNPPVSISKSNEMFLNKLNIINVAVSRARDYLVIVMPDDNTEKVENLTLIKQVEELFKAQSKWVEHHSQNIEELIFGSETYLEDNSFSTSHQLVNVYGKPEKKYEIRSETNAVDLQIFDDLS